jgi:hypothetical protein
LIFYGNKKKWNEFIEYGQSVTNEQLEARISRIAPNKCATLIYTVSFAFEIELAKRHIDLNAICD